MEEHTALTSTLRFRVAGVLLALATIWYVPWAVAHANSDALWIAVPFLGATMMLALGLNVSLINNWSRSAPPPRTVPPGQEPHVVVAVTSAGEPPDQISRTAASVLAQDWPDAQTTVVLSDDSADPRVEVIAHDLQRRHPLARVLYHQPPGRGDPRRRGEAKAGNLNSVLELVGRWGHGTLFLETRDADDEVGDPQFLRQTVGQLRADDRIAYVQTIKEAVTSAGDPFDSLQPHFYRGSMLARHAANAVFPCGSGLVWRVEALHDVGGFPIWNLVEDVESGLAAQARGWRTCYLPIVGARAQHSPEDIPNVYKQRGTWALDTMRLFFWRWFPGLTLRQRLHFLELPLFYLQSFAVLVFIVAPAVGLAFDRYPLTTGIEAYALHFWPFAVAIELFLASMSVGRSYESLWRSRIMWVGLVPVYARACIIALLAGPDRKPAYRVTRKVDEFAWYWRETLPQAGLLVALVGSLLYSAATTPLATDFDFGTALWVVFFIPILVSFLRLSRFGLGSRGGSASRAERVSARRPDADVAS